MLPDSLHKNVFIEITNLTHGGNGWELGNCLWSPERDAGGSRAWKLMNECNQDDIIIHLVDIRGQYHWYGISKTASQLILNLLEPPQAGKWSNMAPYQRVNLDYFQMLDSPYPISDFFAIYDTELRQILDNYKSFYVEYGPNLELRVSQRYFAKCPADLYQLFNQLSVNIGFNPQFNDIDFVPTPTEPQNPDYESPGRVQTTVFRKIRDTALSRQIKFENNWKCQICGTSILLPNGNRYAEGHHLKPLGGLSEGPDTRDNIIILCPTHHAEFDYGSIAINPTTNLINHIELLNPYNNQSLNYTRTDLGKIFIEYHFNERYNK